MSDSIAASRNEFRQMVIDAIRDAGLYARLDDLHLCPPCDPLAEGKVLSGLVNGVISKPFCGLETWHFMTEPHREVFARCHLSWVEIKNGISGDDAAVTAFLGIIKEDCGPFASGELEEFAYRIKELAEQRRLIEMFRKLELELRFGKIQVCDAEHVLQQHLLRDIYGP